jgi:hypothetical protein
MKREEKEIAGVVPDYPDWDFRDFAQSFQVNARTVLPYML